MKAAQHQQLQSSVSVFCALDHKPFNLVSVHVKVERKQVWSLDTFGDNHTHKVSSIGVLTHISSADRETPEPCLGFVSIRYIILLKVY